MKLVLNHNVYVSRFDCSFSGSECRTSKKQDRNREIARTDIVNVYTVAGQKKR